MASILPGFEYDIFISYRQKDNRSDQWVTIFVQALREELDATIKELARQWPNRTAILGADLTGQRNQVSRQKLHEMAQISWPNLPFVLMVL